MTNGGQGEARRLGKIDKKWQSRGGVGEKFVSGRMGVYSFP